MKIYGVGVFLMPGANRVIWDFTDGPFDTVNPVLIEAARKRGLSIVSPPISPVEEKKAEEPVETPKRKPGRPAKVKE